MQLKDHLIKPHGDELVSLLVNNTRSLELKEKSRDWTSIDLSPRQICDLELIINGGFSPLKGFMNKDEYESVCNNMHLLNGAIWPVPVVLDVREDVAQKVKSGDTLALRDDEGFMTAVLHVEDVWKPDRAMEVKAVYGTTNREHPGVEYILNQTNPWYIGGTIEAIQLPEHHDFLALRLTPRELRQNFIRLGWKKIVAFQTRNPMHRAHFELTFRAAKEIEANLLIHPVVGMTKPGDVDHYTRVRCYQALLPHYSKNTAFLSLLPLAMRMGGPREAILHAIIRKNYGCTHLIVGRDHAGPGSDSAGKPFYGPYDAQKLFKQYEDELRIQMVPFKMMVYVEEFDKYYPVDEVPDEKRTLSISGTELRNRLAEGRDIPGWFTFPEVTHELRRTYPPRYKQGFTVFFTGLSSAGKSTVAKSLLSRLLEMGGRPVTLLDGDIVRKNLSSELGFSKAHRDLNIQRIGFVASEITKNGGIAICAPIAPYDKIRKQVRELISSLGGFILVHVATPLSVCEKRDRKGLYAKARAGIIKQFTGISDPYEVPEDAEIALDTTDKTPEEAAQEVILFLEKVGYIKEA
jgi:sulfate adenylyltransferase